MTFDTIALASGEATATIACRGAELRQWQVAGVPLIWTPEPAFWSDTAPVLFPIVGWTRGTYVRVQGRSYPLGLHGFARHLDFAVREQWPGHVRLVASATAETRTMYPFDWELEVEHALAGTTLTTRLTVCNLDHAAMPYACGLHPGFRWPFAGDDPDEYAIVFGAREAADVAIISPEGLFTRQSRKVPLDGRRLALSRALMAGEALCFLDAKSTALRFSHTASGATIDVVLEDFPHLALWSRPPAPFLCIEPWTGHGDFVDADGDLQTKASMRHLAPGATASHGASFTYTGSRAPIRSS